MYIYIYINSDTWNRYIPGDCNFYVLVVVRKYTCTEEATEMVAKYLNNKKMYFQ